MSSVFQACCAACSYRGEPFLPGHTAILLSPPDAVADTQPAGGELASPYRAMVTDDHRLLVLAHPLESQIQQESGHTNWSLLREGRHVTVHFAICDDCGLLQERRRLTPPPAIGCIPSLAAGVCTGVTLGLLLRSFRAGALLSLVATICFLGLAGFAANIYTRLRFRDRARALAGRSLCAGCASDRVVPVSTSADFPCPGCAARRLRIHVVGIS